MTKAPANFQRRGFGSAVRSSVGWMALSSFFAQAMTMVIFLFLASRLSPEEFGVFALALVFIEFVHREGRFSMVDAIVQQQKFDEDSLSTSFWCAMGFAIVLCGLVILASPILGRLFESEKLPGVLAALALTVLPIPFTIGPMAVLNAKMNFRSLALRPIVAISCSSIVALVIVFGDNPEWALVGQRAALICVEAIFLQMAEPTIPKFRFNSAWAVKFSKTVFSIFAAQTIVKWFLRVFDILITVFFGPIATGLWRIAEKIVDAVSGAIAVPLNSLWVITLSREELPKSEKRVFFVNMMRTSSIMLVPAFVGISIVANDFAATFLVAEYQPVGTFLAIYAGFAALAPFYLYRGGALIALKKTTTLKYLAFIDILVLVTISYILRDYGQRALICALGLTYALSIPPSLHVLSKETGATFRQVIASVVPAYIAVFVMYFGCQLVSEVMSEWNSFLRIIILVVSGILLYVGTLLACFKDYTMVTRDLLLGSE